MSHTGLPRDQVKLTAHQDSWARLFKDEAKRVIEAAGDPSLHIEHIGSTAIPGIYAKPIIDMAIPYSDKKTTTTYISPLERTGYRYKGEEGVTGRLFFVKGPEEKRVLYLHIVDKEEFDRLITFRDRLRNDRRLAKEYSDLKLGLAEKFSADRKSYTKSKDKFITDVLSSL